MMSRVLMLRVPTAVATALLLNCVMPCCAMLCSALRDSRFSPVQLKEVAHLSCSVSLLCCFEHAQGWQDWQIGQHGLIIEFTDPVLHCKRTATFLPEVAADQGWSQRQCIESLVRKAGAQVGCR
jgi:AMMECR1 domain-containing protein